ncbi:MAG: DUF2238 domain-containing protein [Sphingobium sp.]
MRVPHDQKWMLATIWIAILLANIAQPYPDLAPLQHGPAILLLLAAPSLLARWPLSSRSLGCIGLFLMLHILGARYIYSYVPYDAWARALTGHDLASTFGWKRNGYDRLVHGGFGALLTLPVAEMANRHGGMARRGALFFAFAAIGLASALYEIFEWLLTVVAAGDMADYYNGQQGDMWDPQKDMAAAQIGSATALIVHVLRSRRGGGEGISAAQEATDRKD